VQATEFGRRGGEVAWQKSTLDEPRVATTTKHSQGKEGAGPFTEKQLTPTRKSHPLDSSSSSSCPQTEKASDTNPKAHPLVGNPPPLSPVQTTPNDHPVNKESDSNRTPERRSHRPKVDTGQTERHRSIEELAGEKGGCEVSLTKMQLTLTINPTHTTPPHLRRANKTFDTTHPSSDECTGQHSNVLVQRRRSHSNVKHSPLEKCKATNIFPARPGTESGMSSRNSIDINLSSRFNKALPPNQREHTHHSPPPAPCKQRLTPNNLPVMNAWDNIQTS
jgi:hypothetical protein